MIKEKKDVKYSRNIIIKNEDIKKYLSKITEIIDDAKQNIKNYEENNQKYELELGRYKEKITPLVKEEDEKNEKGDYEVLSDVKLIDGEVNLIYEDVIEKRRFMFLDQLEKTKEKEEECK